MAYEKYKVYDKMKTLIILMLIGLPLIASTNIDCGGRSFHCVNATHFMICVDVGGGISSTVDDFVIACPPPTACRPRNRFECELPPPPPPPPPVRAQTVLPIAPATAKETTEEFLIDYIFSNTEVEEHLESSTVKMTQDPVTDYTVIPLQYGLVNETTLSVSGKDVPKVVFTGDLFDTLINQTLKEVVNENFRNVVQSSATSSLGNMNNTHDTITDKSSSVKSTTEKNTDNFTRNLVDPIVESTVKSVLNDYNINSTENNWITTIKSTVISENDNITELVSVTESAQIDTTLANIGSKINTTKIMVVNNSDRKTSELTDKNNGFPSETREVSTNPKQLFATSEPTTIKIDTLTNYNTTTTSFITTKKKLVNFDIITETPVTAQTKPIEITTVASVKPPITDTLPTQHRQLDETLLKYTTDVPIFEPFANMPDSSFNIKTTGDLFDKATEQPSSLTGKVLTQKQLTERAINPTTDSNTFHTTQVNNAAGDLYSTMFTGDLFEDSPSPAIEPELATKFYDSNMNNIKKEIMFKETNFVIMDSSTLSDIISEKKDVDIITEKNTTQSNSPTLPSEFSSATELRYIEIYNTTDTHEPIQVTTQPALETSQVEIVQISTFVDGITTESDHKVIVTLPSQSEKKTLDTAKKLVIAKSEKHNATSKTTVDRFFETAEPSAVNNIVFLETIFTTDYKVESSTPETKTIPSITTKKGTVSTPAEKKTSVSYSVQNAQHTSFEPIEDSLIIKEKVFHKANEIFTETIPATKNYKTQVNALENTSAGTINQNLSTDEVNVYSSNRLSDTTLKVIDTINPFTTAVNAEPFISATSTEAFAKKVRENSSQIPPTPVFLLDITTEKNTAYNTGSTGETEQSTIKHYSEINKTYTPTDIVQNGTTSTKNIKSSLTDNLKKPITQSKQNNTTVNLTEEVASLPKDTLRNESFKIGTTSDQNTVLNKEPSLKLGGIMSAVNKTQKNNVLEIKTIELGNSLTKFDETRRFVDITKLQESESLNNDTIDKISEATFTVADASKKYNEQTVAVTDEIISTLTIPLSDAANLDLVHINSKLLLTTESWTATTLSVEDAESKPLDVKVYAENFKKYSNVSLGDTFSNKNAVVEAKYNVTHTVTLPHHLMSNKNNSLHGLQETNQSYVPRNKSVSVDLYSQSQNIGEYSPKLRYEDVDNISMTTLTDNIHKTTEIWLAQNDPVTTVNTHRTYPISSSTRPTEATKTDILPVSTILKEVTNENSTLNEFGVEQIERNKATFTVNSAPDKTKNITLNYSDNVAIDESDLIGPLGLEKHNANNEILTTTQSIPESDIKLTKSYHSTVINQSNSNYKEANENILLNSKKLLENPLENKVLNETNNNIKKITMPTISESNKEMTTNIAVVTDGIVEILHRNNTNSTLLADLVVTEVPNTGFLTTKSSSFLDTRNDSVNDLNSVLLTNTTTPITNTAIISQNIDKKIENKTNQVLDVPTWTDAITSTSSIRNSVNQSNALGRIAPNPLDNYSSISLDRRVAQKTKDNEISGGMTTKTNAVNASVKMITNTPIDTIVTKPKSYKTHDKAFGLESIGNNIKPAIDIRPDGLILLANLYNSKDGLLNLDNQDKQKSNTSYTVHRGKTDQNTVLHGNNNLFAVDGIASLKTTSLPFTGGQESYFFSITPELPLTGVTLEDIKKETLAMNENTDIIFETFINIDNVATVTTPSTFIATQPPNDIQQNIYEESIISVSDSKLSKNIPTNNFVLNLFENTNESETANLPTVNDEKTEMYEASAIHTETVTQGIEQNNCEGQIKNLVLTAKTITEANKKQTEPKITSTHKINSDVSENELLFTAEQEKNSLEQSSVIIISNMTSESTQNIVMPTLSPVIEKRDTAQIILSKVSGTRGTTKQTLHDSTERSIATNMTSESTQNIVMPTPPSVTEKGNTERIILSKGSGTEGTTKQTLPDITERSITTNMISESSQYIVRPTLSSVTNEGNTERIILSKGSETEGTTKQTLLDLTERSIATNVISESSQHIVRPTLSSVTEKGNTERISLSKGSETEGTIKHTLPDITERSIVTNMTSESTQNIEKPTLSSATEKRDTAQTNLSKMTGTEGTIKQTLHDSTEGSIATNMASESTQNIVMPTLSSVTEKGDIERNILSKGSGTEGPTKQTLLDSKERSIATNMLPESTQYIVMPTLSSVIEKGDTERNIVSKGSGTEGTLKQILPDITERSIATQQVLTTSNTLKKNTVATQGFTTTKKEFVSPEKETEILVKGRTTEGLLSTTKKSFYNGAHATPVADSVTEVASTPRTTLEESSVLASTSAAPLETTSTSSDQERITTEAAAFSCAQRPTGRYADDDNCRKFYVCSGMAHPVVGLCPANTVFSEIKKQCTRNLSYCVRKNQFKCVSAGRFSDFMQPNVYYICIKKGDVYLRYKLQCQAGYYLDKTKVQCIKIPEVTTSSNLSESSNISLTANGVQNESSNEKRELFECEDEGKFADPYSCRGYYVCRRINGSDEKYRRKRKICDQDEVFDREKKKCVDAGSNECSYCDLATPNVYYVYAIRQDYLLKFKLQCRSGYILNKTTVRCYKIESSKSSQSASENESRSRSGDKSSGSGGGGFRCAAEGTFRDARDCRRYYECKHKPGHRFKQKHKRCRKRQVFDEEKQKCIDADESSECQ